MSPRNANKALTVPRRRLLAGGVALAAGALAGLPAGVVRATERSGTGAPRAIVATHIAAHEDTLVHLARRNGLGYVEMVAANPRIDPWLPGQGAEITLPTTHLIPDVPREGIAVNLAEMRLYHFGVRPGDIATYPIGVGREGRTTPLGQTTVVRKAKEPTWYPPASVRAEKPYLPAVVPPGPDNPLGHRALYLGWPAYLIHGTHMPLGVGRRVSAGCIRMYPEDVDRLYEAVPVGTKVTVVDQPLKLAWVQGELYLEAHPTLRQADEIEFYGRFEVDVPADLDRTIRAAAGEAVARIDWTTARQAALERRGYPIRITLPA